MNVRFQSFQNHEGYPLYWNMLTDDDKDGYLELRSELTSPEYKNRRNKSLEVFEKMLEQIRKYVVRNDANDKNRGLVVGIMFFDGYQAVNIHQLITLTNKSKSSINGSYHALGYITTHAGADNASEIIKLFPGFKNNFNELRMWTLRQKKYPDVNFNLQPEVKVKARSIFTTPPPDLHEIFDMTEEEKQKYLKMKDKLAENFLKPKESTSGYELSGND